MSYRAVQGHRRHTRVPSGVPAGLASHLDPASPGSTGNSVTSNGSATGKAGFLSMSFFASSGSDLFSAGSATADGVGYVLEGSSSQPSGWGLSAAALSVASSVQQLPPVVSSDLCVVLNSLHEVQSQQQQLAQRIWAELDVHAPEFDSQQQNLGMGTNAVLGSTARSGSRAPGIKPVTASERRPDPELTSQCAIMEPAARDSGKAAVAAAGDPVGAGTDCSDDDSDSDVSVMLFSEEEAELQEQLQPGQKAPASCSSRQLIQQQPHGLGDRRLAAADVSISTSDNTETPLVPSQKVPPYVTGQQQQPPQQPLSQQAAQQVSAAKRKNTELSANLLSLMNELLQLITRVLQLRRLGLLASLFAAWADGERPGADLLSDPGVQLLIAPLRAELLLLSQ